MADSIHDVNDVGDGAERSDLLPAGMVPKSTVSSIVLRSGFSRPPQSNTVDPMALLKSFRRRWALALALGLLMAGVVGLTAWFVVPPPQYTSKSLLKVSSHPTKIIFQTAELFADFKTFQKTQTDLIKSPVVLGPALRNPDVLKLDVVKAQADAQEWLEKEIRVDFNGSELLAISMSSKNPDDLNTIVDAVVASYMLTVVEDEHKSRVTRLENLRKLWNKYQEDLKKQRETVRTLANVIGTEDRSTMIMKQQFWFESMHMLERELQLIQSDLRKYRSYNEAIEEKEKLATTGVPASIARPSGDRPEEVKAKPSAAIALEAAIEARIEADDQVQTLRSHHAAAATKYKKLIQLARSRDDPALVAAKSSLEVAFAAHNDQRDRLRRAYLNAASASPEAGALGSSTKTAGPVATESAITLLRDRMALLKKNEASTIQEIEKLRQQIATLNGQTVDIQAEQEKIAAVNETARKVATEVENLSVELEAPRRITVLYKAELPRKQTSAKQYMICGGASFGGFALAILAVSFWEMKAMRIGSVDEVVNNLGLSLVGTLPTLPSRTGKVAKAEDQRWQGLLVESIDATRTMLLHASRVNATRAVMITSAMKGEGKTSLAAHLATSLARAGRKTLLIDCDLRRPTLHQLFDVARVPGICELLRGEAEVNDVIRPTPADDLNLIPAGHCDGLSLQAIAQDGFRDVLAILKKRYDFIIVDSAPVLPVVDTMLLSQQVDAVLFSIMRDVSRVPHVQAAHERLASLGVRMLGAVVSAVERRDYMHNYDYDYHTSEPASA